MDEQTTAKMIEKVRKLMALAQSPNEHEAALAAERAQAILAEYNLSMADVGTPEQKGNKEFIIDSSFKTSSLPWRRGLASIVAEMYFSKYYFTYDYKFVPSRPNGYIRSDVHNFVGEPHNVEVARSMFEYLLDAIERLATNGSKGMKSGKSQYMTSFRWAASGRLQKRIRDRINAAKAGQVKTETGTNLPALLNLYEVSSREVAEYIQKQVGNLKTKNAKVTMASRKGWHDGQAAGDSIGLDKQVGGGSGLKRLN